MECAMIVVKGDYGTLADLELGFNVLANPAYMEEALDLEGEVDLNVFRGEACSNDGTEDLLRGRIVLRSPDVKPGGLIWPHHVASYFKQKYWGILSRQKCVATAFSKFLTFQDKVPSNSSEV